MRGRSGARPATARAALLAVALGCFAFSACSSSFDEDRGDARRGGSILVGLAEAPDSLDPAVASNGPALQALWQAYTPPMTYRRAGGADGTKTVPALADAAPDVEDDGTTVTFRFREDLRYSSGRPVQASDFARALQRALVLNPAARRALSGVVGAREFVRDPDPAAGIEGVTTDDPARTVRIALAAPDPAFPQLLAQLWAAPVPPGTPVTRRARAPLAGIGPYTLDRAPRGRAYVLTRRKDFSIRSQPQGNADSITGTVLPDAGRRTGAALDGRIDVTQGEPPTLDLPRIRSEDKDRYREFRTLSARYLAFDLVGRPFSDGDLRQAVSFALDLRTLSRLDAGFLQPTCNLIPPQVVGYSRLDPCPFGDRQGDPDLVRAEELVTNAPGRRALVIVDGGDGRRAAALARYGVETLEKIGMRARVARTPADRRRAQLRFAATAPAVPSPAAYFAPIDDAGVGSDAGELVRGSSAAAGADRWANLDRAVVDDAIVAPYGVATTGVLVSERLDASNCLRFSPVYGTDLSSLCLR